MIVTNNGLLMPTLTTVDIASWSIRNTTTIDHAWYGLVWHPDGTKLYAGDGALNTVVEFTYADGVVTLPGDGPTFQVWQLA